MQRVRSDGTIIVNDTTMKELQSMGYSGCDHFDCGCPIGQWSVDNEVLKKFVRKYKGINDKK